ncbi:uncharacterized protein BCR38DRAFT_348379, partial [Pseudomassariella vexata]
LSYDDMAYAAALEFVTTGSNNGHDRPNGTAFFNSIEVVTDVAWHGFQTSVMVVKQSTAEFYDQPHDILYYLGCSTEDRQGFKMTQDCPDFFHGIAAGAPHLA